MLAASSVGQTHHCAPREGVGDTQSLPPPRPLLHSIPLYPREPLGIAPPLPHTPRRPGKPQSVPDPPQTSLSFLSPLPCALGKHISGIPKSPLTRPRSLSWSQLSNAGTEKDFNNDSKLLKSLSAPTSPLFWAAQNPRKGENVVTVRSLVQPSFRLRENRGRGRRLRGHLPRAGLYDRPFPGTKTLARGRSAEPGPKPATPSLLGTPSILPGSLLEKGPWKRAVQETHAHTHCRPPTGVPTPDLTPPPLGRGLSSTHLEGTE